jgi:YD repeat-containing protein
MMKLSKFTLIALCMLFTQKQVYAQSSAGDKLDNLRNVIPPSPEASSLGKYGEWPVSLYTGLPSVSIPIYELKGRGTSVPVSISYNGSGNKVGEIASTVGLGWSLQTAGIISRSVRGIPDESSPEGSFFKQALYSNPNDLCSTPLNVTTATDHKVNVAKGISDGEQDLYSFNALGRSFKFFIKADGTIVPQPYNSVKLTTNLTTAGLPAGSVTWTALFEDGIKFDFGGTGFYEMNNNPRFDIGASFFVTSWLLKKITSVDGEQVDFTYDASSVVQDSYFSESETLKYNVSLIAGQGCSLYSTSGPGSRRQKAEVQQVTMLHIASIENDLGRVEFVHHATEREDLKGSKALIGVNVYSKLEARYITRYRFNQNYSQAATSNEYWGGVLEADKPYYRKRLKLLNLEKWSGDNLSLENRWLFEYNPTALPSRRSYAQDHWGFYNGQVSNTSLLPDFFYPLPTNVFQNYSNAGFNPPLYERGADREGNGTFAEAEILKSIVYPTGGKTSFVYEANTIPVNIEKLVSITSPNIQLNLTATSNPFVTLQEYAFTITQAQNVQLNFNATVSASIYNDKITTNVSAKIYKVGSANAAGGITTPASATTYSETKNFNLLETGNYVLRVSTNAEIASFSDGGVLTASTFLTFKQAQGNITQKNTGGLRLQKMVTTDGINTANSIEKNYIYEEPLIISPLDVQALYFTETNETTCENIVPDPNGGAPSYTSCLNRVVSRNSSTKYSLGNVQGGTVGYGRVTTIVGTVAAVNGKTVSEFNNEQDIGLNLTVIYPYAPTDSREHRRGLLLRQTDYNASNQIVQKSENTYSFIPKSTFSQFKAGFETNYTANSTCVSATCIAPNGDCGIQKLCYGTTSEQVKSISSTSYAYSSDGSSTGTTVTTNYYDNPNNLQPTRIETVNSKGELLTVLSRTPLEKTQLISIPPLTTAELAAIDALIGKNIISTVLQTEQSNGGTLLNRSLITYTNLGNGIIKPTQVRIQEGASAMETRLGFDAYDAKGNLLQQQQKDNIKQAYIYGYQSSLPIAQAVNANVAEIAATSFENAGQDGNWVYTGTPIMQTAPTGKKVYPLATANPVSITLSLVSGYYKVTLWASNASVLVNGLAYARTGKTINGFTYYEFDSEVPTISIIGNALIDELRVLPAKAQMTTYTYEPLVGMTSKCDPNNVITYYQYDQFNRLKAILDQDRNIIKTNVYQYQQAQ